VTIYNGPGWPTVYPRKGVAKDLMALFGEKKLWALDELATRLGKDGRHIYGAVFFLRRRYHVPIRTLRHDDGTFSYLFDGVDIAATVGPTL